MYAGREQQDAALLERFRAGFVMFDYDEKLEDMLFPEDLLKRCRDIRKAIRQNDLNKTVSMHFLKAATKRMQHGASLEAVMDSFFANWSEDEKAMIRGL